MIITEQLREAFERAQQLPDTAQNALAERILEEIEEQEWEAIINKPRVQKNCLLWQKRRGRSTRLVKLKREDSLSSELRNQQLEARIAELEAQLRTK